MTLHQTYEDSLNVSDGRWHRIVVDVRDGYVFLDVDDGLWKYKSTKYHLEHIDHFDGALSWPTVTLATAVFVGGCATPSTPSHRDLSPPLPECYVGCVVDLRHHGYPLRDDRIVSRLKRTRAFDCDDTVEDITGYWTQEVGVYFIFHTHEMIRVSTAGRTRRS